jgi:hypothetical protein
MQIVWVVLALIALGIAALRWGKDTTERDEDVDKPEWEGHTDPGWGHRIAGDSRESL